MAYHVIEGNVVGKKEKIGIVCARFNEFIVSKLLGGCLLYTSPSPRDTR